MTVPSIGAGIGVERLTVPFSLRVATSSSLKPTMRSRAPRGFERDLGRADVVLRGDELGLRLLPVLERRRLAFVEILEPLLGDAREVELGACLVHGSDRRHEIVLRLHDIGAVDLEQRLAAFHLVADLGDQPGDAARKRRQNRGAGILVVGDLTDREFLHPEWIELDLADAELMHLVGGRSDRIAVLRCATGGSARCENTDLQRRKEQRRARSSEHQTSRAGRRRRARETTSPHRVPPGSG